MDHLCLNKICCNPFHLEAVPQAVNNLRSRSPTARYASASGCVNGHKFTAENTWMRTVGDKQYRVCRTCKRMRDETYRRVKRMGAE